MLRLLPELAAKRPLKLLCLGAHSDDAEIGCGGTVLTWLAHRPVDVTWVVLTAAGVRRQEAERSARAFLKGAKTQRVIVRGFRDDFLPAQYGDVKTFFEELKGLVQPDVILTHRIDDRHQDHRITGELTWNTWRDHLVLEYEIPKYEGDLAPPNTFVSVPKALARRKVSHLERYFATQRSKDWFVADNFYGLMRLRGMESRSPSGFAEAFHARKLVL